jgi:phenylacetic acid degradation operon negative regulatory protein
MWKPFHHPDISLPVVRRRAGVELLELLDAVGDVIARGAWALMQNRTQPSRTAYNQAVYRLSKQGLIVKEQGVNTPLLKLSPDAEGMMDPYLKPDRWWNRKWNGIWYLLMYDVPEVDRSYRNVLRNFLRNQRMGCFQKSVWVTPHDIRAQYSDLEKAAAVEVFACLFEARTVLGMPSEKVVLQSWDFGHLYEIQKQYYDTYAENLDILQSNRSISIELLARLAVEELTAFRSAFCLDPLLPGRLLPHEYLGRQVYDLHLRITDQLRAMPV